MKAWSIMKSSPNTSKVYYLRLASNDSDVALMASVANFYVTQDAYDHVRVHLVGEVVLALRVTVIKVLLKVSKRNLVSVLKLSVVFALLLDCVIG